MTSFPSVLKDEGRFVRGVPRQCKLIVVVYIEDSSAIFNCLNCYGTVPHLRSTPRRQCRWLH